MNRKATMIMTKIQRTLDIEIDIYFFSKQHKCTKMTEFPTTKETLLELKNVFSNTTALQNDELITLLR